MIRETLVTTTTTPNDRDREDDDVHEIKQCFICDASVTIHPNADKNHFNLYSTNTRHSNAPVYDFVWKFLGEKSSQRNLTATESDSQWNCVCLSCFQNIEDYDYVTSEAQRLEKLLTNKLTITERMYEERNKAEEDVEIIEVDDCEMLIISDDESDQNEEIVQPPQTSVQLSPAQTQKEKESEDVIDLNSDDGQSEKGSEIEVELVEQHASDPLGLPDERILTFDEL